MSPHLTRREFVKIGTLGIGGVAMPGNSSLVRAAIPGSGREATPVIRDAHTLSRPFNIDPAYSVDHRLPDPVGLSLYSSKQRGPFWLYNWGHLEAYLINRMRQEAFQTCMNIAHPGRFRSFNPMLYAKVNVLLDPLPQQATVRLYHSGLLDVQVNFKHVLHTDPASRPSVVTVDFLPFLRVGSNVVFFRCHRLDEPPTLLVDSGFLQTDARWQVSCDQSIWDAPACLPFETDHFFPHQERLPSLRLRPKTQGEGECDFAVEVLGRPEFLVEGGTGQVALHPGESDLEAKDAGPDNKEQYLPPLGVSPGRATYPADVAMRCLRLTPSPGVEIRDISVLASAWPARYRGAFACSDDALTRIWMHSAYTLRLCMRESFIDGVKRDRLPWVGDLYLGMLCNAYAFGEKDIVHRSLTALYGDDVNHVDLSGIIDYSLYWVLSLRDYLLYFDDRTYLKHTQGRFFDLMASIAARENPDGFLPSESFAWIFIDWAELDKAGLCAPLQMLYAMALDAASHLATLCERLPQARHFSLKAQALRENCRRQFWSSTQCAYVDHTRNGKQGVHTGRHANFFAILSSTATEEQIPLILKNSLMNNQVAPVGTPFMKAIENRALLRCGQAKKVVDSIRTYWGGMLQEGATTFWEAYDDSATGAAHYSFYGRPFGKSLCHAWSAGPLFLLSGDVFGLSPLEPGWKRFAVSPEPTGLEWACTSVPTPCGNIDVQVEAGTVLVRVPEGTTLQSRAQTGEIRLHPGPCTVTEKSPNP